MIPKIIHYCWFGRGQMPEDALKCIESWHQHMPDYQYKLWNEDNFDVNALPYTKEAYEARKFAFVSDVARLKALYEEGGIYLDTDVEVFKPFDDLLHLKAFGGFEASKRLPLLTCIMASEPHGEWVTEQLASYTTRRFKRVNSDGSCLPKNAKPQDLYDMTTNVDYITATMVSNGFIQNGQKQQYKDLTVFPVDYFSPHSTTGEYTRTENTYSNHKCYGSWVTSTPTLKGRILNLFGPTLRPTLIKLKRKIFG